MTVMKGQKQKPTMDRAMTKEHSFVASDYSDRDLYASSQTHERALNSAIVQADISESFEKYLEIFEAFYADDVEVSSEDSRETIRGKASVRPFLLDFLVPLHVMAEVAGLSTSVQVTEVPRDSADQTHSAWKIDFTGVGGRRCTLKWKAVRRWKASKVVYEHHYDHEQIGGPLTEADLNLDSGHSEDGFQLPS